MDDRELRKGFLVIGANGPGQARAMAALVGRGSHLVAVTDPADPEGAFELAERLGVSAAVVVESGLSLDQVDAVVVATPTEDRDDLIRRCLSHGKHVLSDSPIASSPDRARALAMEADELGLRLATGFSYRFAPPVRDALSMLSRWSIGRILSVRVDSGPDAEPDGLPPHLLGEQDALDTLGPAACDLLRRFLGEVVAAKGYLQERLSPQIGTETEALGLFRDHDRGLGELRTSWSGTRRGISVEVIGSEGCLRLETSPWRLTIDRPGQPAERRTYRAEQLSARLFRRWHGCDRSVVLEHEAFVDAIRAERPRLIGATGWDGCRALEMVEAIRRSDWTGEEVALEPTKVRTPSQSRRRTLRRRSA